MRRQNMSMIKGMQLIRRGFSARFCALASQRKFGMEMRSINNYGSLSKSTVLNPHLQLSLTEKVSKSGHVLGKIAVVVAGCLVSGASVLTASSCELDSSDADYPPDTVESLKDLVRITRLERLRERARAKGDTESFGLLGEIIRDLEHDYKRKRAHLPPVDVGLRGMTTLAEVHFLDKALSGTFTVNAHSNYELILEEEDALALGLQCSLHGHHTVYLDGERVSVVEYLPVVVSVQKRDGTVAMARVTPVSLATRRVLVEEASDSEALLGNAGVSAVSKIGTGGYAPLQLRVIGGGALHKIGLHQDHCAHALVSVSK